MATPFVLITAIGLALFAIAVAALLWQVRSGQLDDLDTPPLRMLGDDPPANPDPSTQPPGTRP